MTPPRPVILVVDDDHDIRQSLASVLEEEGFSVALAENGAVAWQILRQGLLPVRLVLLDLMMPVMDGFEFCKLWKGADGQADVPVVIFSADGATEQLMQDGAADGVTGAPQTARRTLELIRELAASEPMIYLPSHDPDSARRLELSQATLAARVT